MAPLDSSVRGNGSQTTVTSAKKGGLTWDGASLQWQCTSSGKLAVSFPPRCYRWAEEPQPAALTPRAL